MTKTEQRAEALAHRNRLSPDQREQYSAEICARLLDMPVLQTARTVFSYLATEGEADLDPLHRKLAERGAAVAFPVTEKHGRMEAYVPSPEDPLRASRYGIREPDPSSARLVTPNEFDVVLAPCVAFDAQCRRLGHGGGYYDRWLPRAGQACVIAVAFEAQRLDSVHTDAYDCPVDMVVTESALYTREKKNKDRREEVLEWGALLDRIIRTGHRSPKDPAETG